MTDPFDPSQLIMMADFIDNRLGPIPGQKADVIAIILRAAARRISELTEANRQLRRRDF